MVGLKAFWILLSTLMFVACVPQTKQTECASNEAFNASLRTCVPIVQGASSFINIKSFVPQFTQTRSKNDTTMLTFSIVVDNPYNQSHSVEWERVFNAAPTYICSNSYTCSFPASYLGTVLGEIGTHIITAKVKDGNGAVVAAHSFELKVNELPRPVIIQPVTPSDLTFHVYPTDPRVQFSFNIKNNGAYLTASQNYRTEWMILKNGSVIHTESDAFTNFTSTGTNSAYLGNPTSFPPSPTFNPANFGVGSYSIRASIKNDDPGEIVAEQYWNLDVLQPPLANVTNISSPEPGKQITAHNGISYPVNPAVPVLSWFYDTSTYPEFCVTVDDRDGTYAADGKSILVKFYLNSQGGDICTVKTDDTPGSQQVCLIGAKCQTGAAPVIFNPAALKFHNSSTYVEQPQKVSARLFDEATNLEFERSNIFPSLGSYPIEWNVLVKPVNTAPQMSFGPVAQNPTGCASTGAYTRSGCQVNQGQPFLVSFTVKDDFYKPDANPEEFRWNVDLKLNGTNLIVPGVQTACFKPSGTGITTPADSGPYDLANAHKGTNQWACQITVPHHTLSGPLSPNAGQFSVVATMEDQGSPVGGLSLISQSLTWNLVVTETNDTSPTAIGIADQSDNFLALDKSTVSIGTSSVALNPSAATNSVYENETVRFNIRTTDQERDNLKFKISLCTTVDCSGKMTVSSPAYIDFFRNLQADPSKVEAVLNYDYTIDEYLLQKANIALTSNKDLPNKVSFEVEVLDVPSILITPVAIQTKIMSFYVKNYNPAPKVNTLSASPSVGSTIPVLSGYPVTINPGTVTDASAPGDEKTIKYQWWARIGAAAWSEIAGADKIALRYTPGNIEANIEVKLCTGNPTANLIDPNNADPSYESCSESWTIASRKSIEALAVPTNRILGDPDVELESSSDEIAVWHDNVNPGIVDTYTYYTVYKGMSTSLPQKMLYVDKTVKKKNGELVSKSTISFSPLDDTTEVDVSNLSITGTTNSLYIAYFASFDSSSSAMIPRVRRIDISRPTPNLVPNYPKSDSQPKEQFGFNYVHYEINTLCTAAGNCFPTAGGNGTPAKITFNSTLTPGDTIEINGYTFTASGTSIADPKDICAAGICTDVNSTATNLAKKINDSKHFLLEGITAEVDGAEVLLFGQYKSDYIDFDGLIGEVVTAKSLGKIFVYDNYWHLPLVNALTAQNKVIVLSGPTQVHLQQSDPKASVRISDLDGLVADSDDMGETASFDSALSQSNELVFARISGNPGDAGRMKIFRYNWGTSWTKSVGPGAANKVIFDSLDFDIVKFAADAPGNNFYYVMAREKSANGGKWHIGRYDSNLSSFALEDELDNRLLSSKEDEVFGNTNHHSTTLMKVPVLVSVPSVPEARIFFSSVGSGTDTYPRLAQWKSDDMISCGSCVSLTQEPMLATAKIGVSQVSSSLEFGSPGFMVTRDAFFAGFHLIDGADAKPYSGIINARAEAIQSNTLDATGLWRPPFVLDQ